MVSEGSFREDLFFRLNVIPIELPLLSERKEDLPVLIPYFLRKYAEEMQRPLPSLSEEAWNRLLAYDYPGNIRQLSNILEYAVAMTKGRVISETDLPIAIRSENETVKPTVNFSPSIIPVPLGATMKEAEKMIIESSLKHCHGSRKETAKMLGISERSLRNKLQIYREEST